jgi:pimeloyl-ACP methyl ester carboxylesterase
MSAPLLSYRVTGYESGLPVVLLHGFGENGSIWQGQESVLQHCSLLIPDWMETRNEEGNSFSSLEEAALLLKEMTQTVWGEREFVLIGHSMGGYIALAFAEAFPEKVLGLGLVHSTALADTPEKKQIRSKTMAFLRESGTMLWIKQAMPNLFSQKNVVHLKEQVDNLINNASGFNPETMARFTGAMQARPDRKHVLSALKKPILFIIGTEDTAVPLADSLSQTHLCDISYIHILKETGHMGMIEAPETVNQALREFIEDIA